MSEYFIAKDCEIEKKYDASGLFLTELFAGSYDGSVRNFKGYLKAGSDFVPELDKDHIVLYMFGKGTGYVADEVDVHKIDEEVTFYFANFEKTAYRIHAFTDMEFIQAVVKMEDYDWVDFAASHIRLPHFARLSTCTKYDQDCKTPNTTSWMVLHPKQLGHIIMGVVRAEGGGTDEKGHPAVHQWNYCLGNADFDMTVAGETVHTVAGDYSFIPAGPDHKLWAEPGKEVFYVWFEEYTRGDGNYIIKLAKGEKPEDKMR